MMPIPTDSPQPITPTQAIQPETHGWRAKCLQRLVRMGLPVPPSFAVSAQVVRAIAAGQMCAPEALARVFEATPVVAVRPSARDPDWGGPSTMLHVGMNDARHAELARSFGTEAADALYRRVIQSYAVHVARLDPDNFIDAEAQSLEALKAAYEDEADASFPQDPTRQLAEVLRSMARGWEGPTARLLRQAKGAPADAALGLVIQGQALTCGQGLNGEGVLQLVDSQTGAPRITGRFRGTQSGETLFLAQDARGASLEDVAPEIFADLIDHARHARRRLREEMSIEFVIADGELSIIDAVRVARSSRAAVRIAVDLARDGVISTEDAVMRVEPRALSELVHPQVNPNAPRDVIARGINASPGAATGRIVFSAQAAQAAQSRGEACVLVRRETGPEDIRGMHAAVAVLTERGGMTSHAAVIARGLGLPGIVGAQSISVDARQAVLRVGKRVLNEGDQITIDGTSGEILAGAAQMMDAALDSYFAQLLAWADDLRQIGVRANADTPEDARAAMMFEAQGIGLCRTEHMFFDETRLPVMREMIFADRSEDRRLALDRLLPIQRDDFVALFRIMAGLPVTIRLFDPPLHEFLPHDREGMLALADSLDLPVSDVTRRVESLSEYNPMLGMRGVRLGVTIPEIYEMQARAIFEAVVEAGQGGDKVVPEIMIPLVSAMREVELVKTRIDAIAAEVRTELRAEFTYRLGVMVETPRAALRAGDIATHSTFLSFGTNDLTQMTYGLSRDDAGRFMGTYVKQCVYEEDPFHILDEEGVGELILLGAARARRTRPDITLSVCGEHGGNAESIAFCLKAGLDYVSCSPFRVPVARLAAAQETVRQRRRSAGDPSRG